MATYMVFVASKATFVSKDKRKAKKAYRKTPTVIDSTEPVWGEKVIYQTVTLWKDSTTIGAK